MSDSPFTTEEIQRVRDHLTGMAGMFADRVAPAYEALNWTWAWCGGVPEPYHIEQLARSTIALLRSCEAPRVSSGGIVAWASRDPETGEIECGLTFEVEHSTYIGGER